MSARERSFGASLRDREGELRAVADLALDPDPAPVKLNELPAESQAQPGTLRLLVRSAHLPELFEDCFLILRRDADPRIRHRDLNRPLTGPSRDLDATALGRELDGIGEQVQNHLPNLPLIRLNLAKPFIN